MPRKPKRYWRIEIEQRREIVFRKDLPGNLSPEVIADTLQRLACRDLSAAQIVSSSIDGSNPLSLRARRECPSTGDRMSVYLINYRGYTANRWLRDEIPNEPEIDLLLSSWT
jgi:hypothetical protein